MRKRLKEGKGTYGRGEGGNREDGGLEGKGVGEEGVRNTVKFKREEFQNVEM